MRYPQSEKVADDKGTQFLSHMRSSHHLLQFLIFFSINEVEVWKWIVRVTAVAEGSISHVIIGYVDTTTVP